METTSHHMPRPPPTSTTRTAVRTDQSAFEDCTARSLGWSDVGEVRVGKVIYLDVEADSAEEAVSRGEAMCRKLLANPVTEDFNVALAGELSGARA